MEEAAIYGKVQQVKIFFIYLVYIIVGFNLANAPKAAVEMALVGKSINIILNNNNCQISVLLSSWHIRVSRWEKILLWGEKVLWHL